MGRIGQACWVALVVIAVELPAGAYPLPPHVAGQSSNLRLRAGYLDASLYDGWEGHRVDPSGVKDSTAALQKAIEDAYDYGLTTYVPAGTYLVSGTLWGNQVFQTSGCAQHIWPGLWGTPYNHRKAPSLVGPARGARPLLRLADGSAGFNDAAHPRAVVHFRNCTEDPASTKARCDDPDDWVGNNGCAMDLVIANIDVDLGSKNPGAIGVQIPSAQYSYLENVRVTARDGYAGIRGVPTTNVSVNLEVDGGRYGIIPHTCCGPIVIGAKLTGQREAAIYATNWSTVVFVGFEIEIAKAPAVLVGSGGGMQTSHVSLVDGRITVAGGSNPAIDNAIARNLYLRNVFFQTAGPLVKSGSRPAVPSQGGWDLVREYVHTNSQVHDFGGVAISSYALIEGQLGQPEVSDVNADPGPPPTDLVSRHVYGSLPSFEDPGVVNVCDPGIGAAGDGVTDDTDALQRAIDSHDSVFLPRGNYIISRTLELRAGTRLFGIPGRRTHLHGPDWHPVALSPFLRTADDAAATTYVGDIALALPGEYDQSYLYGLEWRAGRGLARQIDTSLAAAGSSLLSQPRALFHISGHGGGRIYAISPHLLSSSRIDNPGFRALLIEGTSEPLTVYGPNLEHAAKSLHFGIDGASNVRILGVKTETMGSSFLRVAGSSNILFVGHAGNAGSWPDSKEMFRLSKSSNVTLANVTMYSGSHFTSAGKMVVEDGMGSTAGSIGAEHNCSLYRRGVFDDSVFPRCGDGYCDWWTEDATRCGADCGGQTGCGDGVCVPPENCVLCPADCCAGADAGAKADAGADASLDAGPDAGPGTAGPQPSGCSCDLGRAPVQGSDAATGGLAWLALASGLLGLLGLVLRQARPRCLLMLFLPGALVLLLGAGRASADMVFPKAQWLEAAPEEVYLNAAKRAGASPRPGCERSRTVGDAPHHRR